MSNNIKDLIEKYKALNNAQTSTVVTPQAPPRVTVSENERVTLYSPNGKHGVNSLNCKARYDNEGKPIYPEGWQYLTEEEVKGLMSLLIHTIEAETPTLNKNNVRLLSIGDNSRMPEDVRKRLQACIDTTKDNTGLTLVLALSYSSRWEITKATQDIAKDIASGAIKAEEITEELISGYMCTKNIPDPELLIRTSGEYRISNFLLWQIAYSELYFTEVLWPDFQKEDLYKAIVNYQSRERRFGKTSEQVTQ